MNILKRILRVISNLIFYILLAIIVLLVVYVGVVTVYKKQNRLDEIPLNFYTILTTSMVPEIQAGDIVITIKSQNNLYNEKDVITFISEGNMTKGVTITHRILKRESINGTNYYYTKGDANNTADTTPVSENNVIGKVILKIPKAGYLQQFMVSKFGWLVVIVLPCLSIIIYDVVKIFEKIFKIKQGKEKLSKNNTIKQREDLNRALNSYAVSTDLQDKIDTVYESIGVDNNIVNDKNIDKKIYVSKEEENVEIL